jgi:hypothetical protein
MITTDTEFYSSPYYFLLRDKGEKYSLYYSVEENLTEARKKDEVIHFEKSKGAKVKNHLKKVAKEKKIKTTKGLKKDLEELVNLDGALSNSKIPILDPRLHPKKTMDQTVAAARITNDPISRGYRTYYGESVEEVKEGKHKKIAFYDDKGRWFSSSDNLGDVSTHKKRFGNDITFSVEGYEGKFNTVSDFKKHLKDIEITPMSSMFSDSENAKERVKQKRIERINKSKLDEVDMSGAFGYEETEDMDGAETYKYLVKKMGMEPDEAKERTKQKGQDPTGNKDKKSKYYKDKNFVTRATLSEIQKQKMIKVVEDILMNKKNSNNSEIGKKEMGKSIDELPLLIRKNLKSLLNHVEKNGYSKEDLIKLIKKGE